MKKYESQLLKLKAASHYSKQAEEAKKLVEELTSDREDRHSIHVKYKKQRFERRGYDSKWN